MFISSSKYIYVLFGAVSCGGVMSDSALDGSNYQEISDYEAKNGGAVVEPLYNGIGLTDANQTRIVKVGIFITYDGDVHRSGAGAESDTGTKAYANLKDWFKTVSDRGGLLDANLDSDKDGKPDSLKEIVEENNVGGAPLVKRFNVKGYGRELWKVDEEAYWDITVTIGYIDQVHKKFGQSIAENDITMINGHFYKDQLDNKADDKTLMQRFFGGGEGPGIYPEAIEAFKSNYNPKFNPYKIVVVNGCKSEPIEELIIDAAKALNAGKSPEQQLKIDIIGHRGFSNFNHFGPQITSFLSGLLQNDASTNATDWKHLITALTFNRPADPATAAEGMTKVEPVLRRYPPQFKDAVHEKDKAKGSQL